MATTAAPPIGALYVLPSNDGESRQAKIEALRRALADLGAVQLCSPEEKVRAVDISNDLVVMQGGNGVHETTVLSLQSDLDEQAVVQSLAIAIAQDSRECRVLKRAGDGGFGLTVCSSLCGKGVRVTEMCGNGASIRAGLMVGDLIEAIDGVTVNGHGEAFRCERKDSRVARAHP